MAINIKIRDNGPYLVEGEFTLTDARHSSRHGRALGVCRMISSVS